MSGTLRRYYRGADLVAMKDVVAGTKSVYHFDHQGTTQCLTDAATRAVTDTFAGDAWGMPVKRTGITSNRNWYIGNFGYYGQTDRTANYVRRRDLDPSIGRWISTDPYITRQSMRSRNWQSVSQLKRVSNEALRSRDLTDKYVYSESNPVRLVDPSGELSALPYRRSDWEVGNDPKLCGHFFAAWMWWLDNPAQCNGWIVQRVHFTRNETKCDNSGINALPVTYFEAWPVSKGQFVVTQGPPYSFFASFGNDRFEMDRAPETFGETRFPHSIRGDAKFFCEDAIGGPLDKMWTGKVDQAGGLPSILIPPGGSDPPFWSGPGDDPPIATHWCRATWNCCSKDCKGWISSSSCGP